MEDAMKGSEFTIARYYALQAVKQQWKDRGKRLPDFGELRREARDYLDNHPELIELATESYRSLVLIMRRRPPRKLKLCRELNNKRSAELHGLSLCRYRERNGGQE